MVLKEVGYETSKEFLFENSYFIITKTEKSSLISINKFKDIVNELKAIPIIIDAKQHDYIVSIISHAPHVIAATLVNMVKKLDSKNQIMKTLAAGGFKDITRIASSDPTMWSNICKENKDEIINSLKIYILMLENFINNIENEEKVFEFFKSSKNYRDSFINKKINGNSMPELDVNIKDEKGAIARIANILSNNDISIRNIEVLNNRESNYGALKIVFRNFKERDIAYKCLTKKHYDIKQIDWK